MQESKRQCRKESHLAQPRKGRGFGRFSPKKPAVSLRAYGTASCRWNDDFGNCISGSYANNCCRDCTSSHNACYSCEVNPDANGGAACYDNEVIVSCLEQYNCKFEDYPPWYRYSTDSGAHCDQSVM
jgi:hypothetical protein